MSILGQRYMHHSPPTPTILSPPTFPALKEMTALQEALAALEDGRELVRQESMSSTVH